MIRQRISIGIIENQHQQVLVAQRKQGKHLQGCWEFPGGKVEPQESFKMALRRELNEELGIHAHSMTKLIELQHQYEDRHLHFQVFKIDKFFGRAQGVELQQLQWVSYSELALHHFPAANSAMLDALMMPSTYMIADKDVFNDELFSHVQKQLHAGVSLIQYRACSESRQLYVENAMRLKKLCEEFDAKLICNCDLAWIGEINADGIHLNSRRLYDVSCQPNSYKGLEFFSVSCHNEEEVQMANKIGVRCMLIGSVNQTQSHTESHPLGWSRFNQLCSIANRPVYALGGMSLNDVKTASVFGAQGIAAIRAFSN